MATLADTLGLIDTFRADDRVAERHRVKAAFYAERVGMLDVTVGDWRVTTGNAVVSDAGVLEVFDVAVWFKGQAVPVDPHRQWINPPVAAGLAPRVQIVGDVIEHTVAVLRALQ